MTVTQIIASGEFEPLTSPQKISALLKQLIEADKVVKTVEKKTSYFAVTTDEVEGV